MTVEEMQAKIKEQEGRIGDLECALSGCLSTMDNIHGYDYDSYREGMRVLNGEDEE
ncbi:hypothetical protein [Bacillus cereus]|uniref:Phage protein n=1 Tax=Bacillus cereus TIAC219 TaxID=718222 RepID=A0ABC9SQH8_BACCE|nr:hypothetical protein [Bacillus cereus]EJP81134.1 hypothetical protein IC1_06622 [Bacillus cereus VD022]EOQ57837.1 hypothetical protein IAY_06249 [Bacillus cereus TIAC219]